MLDHVAHALLALLLGLVGIVLGILEALENFLRDTMNHLGLPHPVQTVLALFAAVVFLVAAFRLFGGFIRVVLIVVILAIVVHAVTHNDYSAPRTLHI
jgi:hypothetical protein